MSLRLVDKLVREENYAKALRVLVRVREQYPDNPYLPAYEERLRVLVDAGKSRSEPPLATLTVDDRLEALAQSPVQYDLPPVERQLNAVATPRPPSEPTVRSSNGNGQRKIDEQKRVGILSKIASLIGQANAYFARNEYDRALEEISRANLLDPDNKDIHDLERKIRKAKEEAHERELEQLRIAQKQEEAERTERLREERERMQREQEETRSRQEEARRIAQEQKLGLCLRRSREFLESGLLAEAQTELAFALVIDPDSRDAAELEREIARKHEEARQAEIERKRREEEERRREEERLQAEIHKAISTAEKASAKADFAEALRVITRAYVLDPTSKDLMSAESGILASRDEWARKQQEELRAKEEEQRRKRDEEQRLKEEEERERLLAERLAEAEAQQKEDEARIEKHLGNAKRLLGDENYDHALAEVALAFVINPFSDAVKGVEREVLLAQGAARTRTAPAPEPEPAPPPEEPPARPSVKRRIRPKDEPQPDDEVRKLIISHLEKASVYASRGNFAAAFDQIAKAHTLAPLDQRVAECEASIQARFVEYQESNAKEEENATAGENEGGSRKRKSGKKASATGNQGRGPKKAGRPDLRPAGARSERMKKPVKTRRFVFATAASLAVIVLSGLYINASKNTGRPSEGNDPVQNASLTPEIIEEPGTNPLTPPIVPREQSEASRRDAGTSRQLQERSGDIGTMELAKLPVLTPVLRDSTGDQDQSDGGQPSSATISPPAFEGVGASEKDSQMIPEELDPLATVRPPEIIRLDKPTLSEAALKSAIDEEVSVMVEIGVDGQPLQAKIVKSSNPLYNHAVIDAVMNSEYRPGQSHAGPITMWMTIPFKFKP